MVYIQYAIFLFLVSYLLFFNPNQMTIVEEPPPTNNLEPNIPEIETPKIPEEEKKMT